MGRLKAKQTAEKQKADDSNFSCSPEDMRQTDPQVKSKDSCFFCGKTSGQLQRAATKEVCAKQESASVCQGRS